MECFHPITVKNHSRGLLPKETFYHQVPCGKCIACRLNYQRSWTSRLLMELLVPWQGYACFLTLTYDDEHIPVDHGLSKRDLQLFFKRHRSLLPEARRLRYFACGEYGDTFNRPHYHAIVYGVSQPDRKVLREAWKLGFIKVGSVEPASIRYVCDYVLKKDSRKVQMYADLQEPFVVMSQGLGKEFMYVYHDKLMNDDYFSYQGTKYPLSRYFKDTYLSRWQKYKRFLSVVKADYPPDYELLERRCIERLNKFKEPKDRIYD